MERLPSQYYGARAIGQDAQPDFLQNGAGENCAFAKPLTACSSVYFPS